VRCQVELQARAGGNADIGRALYPMLDAAGFGDVQVSPRMVYVDGSRPHLIERFTRNTFTAMIEGIREQVIAAELMTPDDFEAGVRDLLSTATHDGVFSYTFFKAVGIRWPAGRIRLGAAILIPVISLACVRLPGARHERAAPGVYFDCISVRILLPPDRGEASAPETIASAGGRSVVGMLPKPMTMPS
jgi:hypothetical protein